MIETLDQAPVPFRGTEIHTLPNGLKLLLKEDHTVPVVSMQAWARCGAIDETPSIYGISHGLEHMVFKGTPTRSAGEITRHIESNGGVINAATQLETTHYYIDVPSYGAKNALDVLADTILHPTFPEDELKRERLVILEEIHRRDDDSDATLWDEFAHHIFKGSPYGIRVIGNKKTVLELSQKDLLDYYQAHYVPSKKSIVVVGDFNKKEMLDQLLSLFENEPAKDPPVPPTIDVKAPKEDHVLKKPIQLAYFAIGIPTVGLGDPDAIGLDLLADVLGGGTSSRLYQTLREERKLVLSISCDYIGFQHKGLFVLFGESTPDKANEAINAIKKELSGLNANPIKEGELLRAKARIKSDWMFGTEAPRGISSTLGSLSSLNVLNQVTSYLPTVEQMTLDQLSTLYKRHIENQRFVTTKIVPES